MDLITTDISRPTDGALPVVEISVDRHTLAKRRWRGVAADGREFGFDLAHPLADGDLVFADAATVYRLAQRPESVLAIHLDDPTAAARLGWLLGNLHFRIAAADGTVQVPDDPAVRQMLEREHIHFHPVEAVFSPLGGGHAHGPGHAH